MFIKPEHSLIDAAAASHGVLSHIFSHHLQDRPAAYPAAFNQADDHPHVFDDHRIGLDRRRLARRSFALGSLTPVVWLLGPAALIEVRLLSLAHGITVIGGAALGGDLLAVSLPTAEGAPQVVAPRIARVGKEENAAVPAPGPAGTQVRLGPQHRSQQPVVLQYQGCYGAPAIPIRLELKMLCDPCCKKPKLWLKMLMLNDMSPS